MTSLRFSYIKLLMKRIMLICFILLILAASMMALTPITPLKIQGFEIIPNTIAEGGEFEVKVIVENNYSGKQQATIKLTGDIIDDKFADEEILGGQTKEFSKKYQNYNFEKIGSLSVVANLEIGSNGKTYERDESKAFFTVVKEGQQLSIPDNTYILVPFVALILLALANWKHRQMPKKGN